MPIGAFRLNTLSAAISAAVANRINATGGTISYPTIGGTTYKLHTFTTTGTGNTFIVNSVTGDVPVDAFLVGGGGAGGGVTATPGAGGGGGAGAVVYQTGVSVTAQSYTIGVGAGGTGSSGANGGAGTSSTGLGYTANGGAGGTVNSAATNGAGSGSNSTTSYTSTIGTYAYKGGNSFGSSTSTSRASGGGAGAGGAGVNAASGAGGNAGLPIQNTMDGNTSSNSYYAAGGGGSGTTAGIGYDRNGGSQGAIGAGRNTSGAGNTASVGAGGTYGGGGGGALNTATTAYAGGGGAQGIVKIRYPFTDDYIQFVTSQASNTTLNVLPTTVQDGDIGILFQGAENTTTTAPTAVDPSGWTSVINTSQTTTAGLRLTAHYKVLTAAEANTTITTMSGTNKNNSIVMIYRPSRTFTLSTASVNQQATSSAPTNQTLTMTSITGPYLAFCTNYSTGTGTMSSTTTATRSLNAASQLEISSFESIDYTLSFTTSTISMTDGGQQALASFRLVLT